MSLTIAYSHSASVAHRMLQENDALATRSLAKLSSGQRVVSARDDAASLAISSRMKAEVGAFRQAAVNAGQASSLLQIADGAAASISDILSRMKTLSVQSASDQISDTERAMINTEFLALRSEIDRTASDADFNGQGLVDHSGIVYTIRSDASEGEITLNGRNIGLGDSFTQSDLESGAVQYNHAGGATLADDIIVSIANADGSALGVVTGAGDAGTFEDAEYFNSDYLSAINASTAYARGGDGSGVMVAVIDTGVDLDHTDLDDNLVDHTVVLGLDVGDDDNVPEDDSAEADHGTHVAGIIGAESNDSGTMGVAFEADILPVKVALSDGSFTTQEVADGINKAVTEFTNAGAAGVINLSLGFDGFDATLLAAINNAIANDVVVVAAAGNFRGNVDPDLAALSDEPLFPANFASLGAANVLAVGATDFSNEIASFSHLAGDSIDQFVVAPGVNVLSTTNDGGTGTKSGTSMASPVVAGSAAVLRQMFPSLSATEIVSLITSTSTDLGDLSADQFFGQGLVDLAKASVPQTTISFNVTAGEVATLTESSVAATNSYDDPFDNLFTQFSFAVGTGVETNDRLTVQLSALTASALDVADLSVDDVSNAETALERLNTAIDTLNVARAAIGAFQNRLGFAAQNLSTTIENVEASRSTLVDLDVASEMSRFASLQILNQAGVSMLAQANQVPQTLMRLLG